MSSIYYEVAQILLTVDKTGKGIRDVFYEKKNRNFASSRSKQVFALACNVVKHKSSLKLLLEKLPLKENGGPIGQILQKENRSIALDSTKWSKKQLRPKTDAVKTRKALVEYYILLSMTWDILWGKRVFNSGGAVARQLRILQPALLELKNSSFDQKITQNTKEISRFLRINTSQANPEAISQELATSSIHCVFDFDIPYVLKLVNNKDASKILQHSLYKNGTIVFQDKASCLSSISCGIKPGMHIIDVCAAPGSKTLHCLDLLQGQGTLIAIEKSCERAKILMTRLSANPILSGPYSCLQCNKLYDTDDNVQFKKSQQRVREIQNKDSECQTSASSFPQYIWTNATKELMVQVWVVDFFSLTNSTPIFNNIDAVLVDPSCSGTGLPLHSSFLSNDNSTEEANRLQQLAKFQTKILDHALKLFNKAKTICYSTCSTYIEENEAVVYSALKKNPSWRTIYPLSLRCTDHHAVERKEHYLSRIKNAEALPELDSNELDILYDQCFHSDSQYDECRGFFLAKLCRSVIKNHTNLLPLV